MKKFFLPILCAVMALATSLRAQEPRVVQLDPAKTQGVWQGWGVSLCWWAKMLGDRDDLADLLFTTKNADLQGQSVPGLGLNIVRYNAGACGRNEVDGRRMVVSKTIQPFRQLDSFWLDGKSADPASKSWDWSVDANQRAMLQKARDRGANRFELFSNSPPWWMCANDNPSGRASKTEDNLLPANYDAFATYLATIARQAKDRWGVAFTTVEPFNEPTSGYWTENGKQEGCYFSSVSEVAFLPHLRAALDRQGLKETPIAASDETSFSGALKSWDSYPPAIRALVSQVNVHAYQGRGPRAELAAAVARDKKGLWLSEHGDKFGDGLDMAHGLMQDFGQLRPVAWCYWQAFDGGAEGGWGLVGADLMAKRIERVNPKYFVLAQFTRHIRPGMTILETGDENVVAAHDPAKGLLVIVLRGDEKPATKEIDLSKFHVVGGAADRWITQPKGTTRHEKQPGPALALGRLRVEVPPDSIQTVEIANARP